MEDTVKAGRTAFTMVVNLHVSGCKRLTTWGQE